MTNDEKTAIEAIATKALRAQHDLWDELLSEGNKTAKGAQIERKWAVAFTRRHAIFDTIIAMGYAPTVDYVKRQVTINKEDK